MGGLKLLGELGDFSVDLSLLRFPDSAVSCEPCCDTPPTPGEALGKLTLLPPSSAVKFQQQRQAPGQ